jgi:nitrogen fixation protein NifX
MKVTAKLTVSTPPDGAVRVAFATTDGLRVDDHFGWAKRFLLYDVSAAGYVKAGKIEFDGSELSEKGNDDKLTDKIAALTGCHLIYSVAVGGPAAARLTRARIQPMVVKEEDGLEALLTQLTGVMRGTMPPWLRKITKTDDPTRFDRWDEEEED